MYFYVYFVFTLYHINILFDANAKLDEHNIRLISCLIFQINLNNYNNIQDSS